jgi:alkylation response protein AidB-like acyl-CoA dehydrogenase
MFDSARFPRREMVPLRLSVRAFLAEELVRGGFVPRPNCWMNHDAAFSRRAAAAGFIGLALPEEFGGKGRSMIERHVVCEEMLAAGAPVGAHWIAERQSAPQILRHGSERLRRQIVPRIAAGECYVAIGMSEPNVGSDLASVESRARRSGDRWLLSGAKLWSTNAHKAHYLIALCRTAPAVDGGRHAGLTQVVVDLARPGVKVSPISNIAGEEDFCEIHFDDYQIMGDEVLGQPGEGWKLVNEELALERSGPDRVLSTYPLLAEAILRKPAQTAAIGRLLSHIGALEMMSAEVTADVDAGGRPDLQAIMVKDLGTSVEREVPEAVRAMFPEWLAATDDCLSRLLDDAILHAPSFTLRGGTREILRGLIARGVGAR